MTALAKANDPFMASRLRRTILRMAFAGSTVHIGCAFSIVEIVAVLYRSHLRMDKGTPHDAGRDYLVLSKGHGVMAQYACLYELGWLQDADLDNYFKDATRLKGLSDCHVPGLEVTSGSLGHGLSVAAGMALAAKRRQTGQKCFCLVGDGEINEGSIWEALIFAAHFKLGNLLVIVDENRFQAMGTTAEVMDMGDLQAKFTAFGCDTLSVDGHDEGQLDRAIHELMTRSHDRPRAVIARTVKGKGVSFMENNNIWHYTRLTKATYNAALAELDGGK